MSGFEQDPNARPEEPCLQVRRPNPTEVPWWEHEAKRPRAASWTVAAEAHYLLAFAFFAASASICDRFLLPATQPSVRATPDSLSSVQPCVTPAASFLP